MSYISNDKLKDYYDSEMLYNKINYDAFNVERFNKNYDVVKILYTPEENDKDKWVDFEDEILDDLAESNDILSVSFTNGRCVYLLINKENASKINEILKCEKYKKFKRDEFFISEEKRNTEEEGKNFDIVYNLLLNALSKRNEGYSNLSGQLYVHACKRGKEIITMNYHVKDGLLLMKQQKFIKVDKKAKDNSNNDQLEKENKKRKRKPRYIIRTNGNNIEEIRRKKEGDNYKGELYKKGSIKRKSIPYDDLYGKIAKVKLFHDMMSLFNLKYKGITSLEFEKIPVKVANIRKIPDIKKDKYSDFNDLQKINIVIADDVEISDNYINKIIEIINEFDIEVTLSERLDKNGKNIFIIHDKEHYKKNEIKDIKMNISKDAIVQSITIECLNGEYSEGKSKNLKIKDLRCIIEKLLSELIIKEGLKNRKFKHWEFDEYEFYLAIRNKKQLTKEWHILMKVKSDSSFEIIDDVNQIDVKYTKYIYGSEFKKYNGEYKDGNVCIVCKDGEMNRIIHTDYIPIMDKDAKEKRIKGSAGENSARSRKKIYIHDKMAYPYVGKSVMILDNMVHYTVGLEDNPNTSTPIINNIYKIKQLLNDEDEESKVIPEILDMLRDYHVRGNSTESVRPFPFKYMLEYIRINNPGKSIYLK